MALKGNLSEYSLPEIFQFVEQGYKTGLLSIQPGMNDSTGQSAYYIWIQGGRIVAMTTQLDNQGLLSLIKQRNWLKGEALNLVSDLSQLERPLGSYLKAQGVLTSEQIKLLFHAQVLRPVCSLFKLTSGRFAFESAPLPRVEMTGLNLSATEATLLGLRVLQDWSGLAEKLPDPTSGLMKAIGQKPQLRLDPQEWQVCEFTDGSVSLSAIALQLQLPVETVQQVAFRMIVVGLVEEVPIVVSAPKQEQIVEKVPELAVATNNSSSGVNSSFLQNLMGFLKNKVR